MDFEKLIDSRYSVRKFSSKEIPNFIKSKIIRSVLTAPSALNYQSQRILVIESDEALKKLRQITKYSFNAPLALLVSYDANVSAKSALNKTDNGIYDASISATYILLAAVNLGLGATWVSHFDYNEISKAYSLPDNIKPVALIPIGYPAEDSQPSGMHNKSISVDDVVALNSY